MCGRYAFTGWDEELIRVYDLEQSKIRPRYNIAPTQLGTVILLDPDLKKPVAQELTWGLIPHWEKSKDHGAGMINARAETVDEKPTFKASFRHRRCLVPASGFYEWRREGKQKTPYYFSAADPNRCLVLAGLWEDWSGWGEHVRSFTILTTQANAVMQPIHDRMPVILPPNAWNRWLDPTIDTHATLADLLRPCNDDFLQCRQIGSYVNKVGNEGPECISPLSRENGFIV